MYYSNKTYAQAIEDAGGVPLLIPIIKDLRVLSSLLAHIDGLLLPGGIDIHPSNYQEETHPALRETDVQLDELELSLARWALREDIPTLGICRGLQMLNVALDGTLYQDLASEGMGSVQHANWGLQPNKIIHRVQIEPGSQMEEVLGVREIAVNSLHHQAIKEPGKGVFISGRSEDDIIESLELPERSFVMAVQCHPEELYIEQPVWTRLFKAFIDACIERKAYSTKATEQIILASA
jgi:putative glutamine amidotransferase